MKSRALLELFCSILFPLLFLACAVQFYAGGDVTEWIRGHSISKLLWLVDFCAIFACVLMLTLTFTRNRVFQQAAEVYTMQNAQREQLEIMVTRASALEEECAELKDQLTELEENGLMEAKPRAEELTVSAEQLLRTLQSQTEAHARHLEAINLALQYHRAEIAQLRQQLRHAPAERDPEELDAILTAEPTPDSLLPAPEKALLAPAQEPAPALDAEEPEVAVISLEEAQTPAAPLHADEADAETELPPPVSDDFAPNALPAFALQSEVSPAKPKTNEATTELPPLPANLFQRAE